MKRKQHPTLAYALIVGLIIWALACDLARLAWRYAVAHPVQAAGWALGLVIIVIVVCTVFSLGLED